MHTPRWNRRQIITAGAALASSSAFARSTLAQDASPAASPAGGAQYPLTVSHAGGETVLEQEPQRIVALEWSLVEDLLVLGIQPVAIADVDGFRTWVTIETELADDVQDVGLRQEPSLESIAGAEPDLILGTAGRDMPIYDQLSGIAPTILETEFPTEKGVTPLDDRRPRRPGAAGYPTRPAAAAAAIGAMDATIDEKAAAIDDAGLTGAPYVVIQGYTSESAPVWRIFTDQALVGDAISATGLVNAWTVDGGDWGFTTNSVENFIELPEDVNVFYIVNDTDNIVEGVLADDPIWQSLSFVQEGRFFPLGGDTWTFGSTESVQRIVNRSTEQITGTAQDA
jgi:ABC-type Fe3+-hydroxamate transport system substrate-binding protein